MTDTQSPWIPVTERMPDTEAMPLNKQYVLVCEVMSAAPSPIEVARYIEDRWLAVDGFPLQCVTHWQPLPELPLTTAPKKDTPLTAHRIVLEEENR